MLLLQLQAPAASATMQAATERHLARLRASYRAPQRRALRSAQVMHLWDYLTRQKTGPVRMRIHGQAPKQGAEQDDDAETWLEQLYNSSKPSEGAEETKSQPW